MDQIKKSWKLLILVISVIAILVSFTTYAQAKTTKDNFFAADCDSIRASNTKVIILCENGLIGLSQKVTSNSVKVFWFFKEDFNKNFTCTYRILSNNQIKANCIDPNNIKKNYSSSAVARS